MIFFFIVLRFFSSFFMSLTIYDLFKLSVVYYFIKDVYSIVNKRRLFIQNWQILTSWTSNHYFFLFIFRIFLPTIFKSISILISELFVFVLPLGCCFILVSIHFGSWNILQYLTFKMRKVNHLKNSCFAEIKDFKCRVNRWLESF